MCSVLRRNIRRRCRQTAAGLPAPGPADTSQEEADPLPAATLAAYDEAIAQAGGIDMQLLGIGCNGHIGFNEPGTPLESLTHVVELTQNTREVNARFFESLDDVPTHAATMGIKTVMNARKLLLIALGESKADAVYQTIKGPVSSACPASVLQLHPDAVVFLDEAAASKL
jgi:glucosamine-6-phosphate deaminase